MKLKRIFTCKKGHSYESKEPITTSWAEKNQPKLNIFFNNKWKANDRCKFCHAQIIKEDDYLNGKIIMGAVLSENL